MTTAAAIFDSRPPLLEVLQKAFSPEALGALCGEHSQSVPWEVWDQALYGPLAEFLSRPGKELRGRLVAYSWTLAGGSGEPPQELPWLVELLHAGSLIVDDIEDGAQRRRGKLALHCLYGVPTALNAGNWLYFLPLSRVDRLELDDAQKLAVHNAMTRCLLSCHYGQALDLGTRMSRLSQRDVPSVVETTTRLKTAGLTELATTLGAIAAGAGSFERRLLGRFGHEIGVGLQMLDDLGGITSARPCHKAHEDLLGSRPTWPWAWLAEALDADAYAELQLAAREVETRDLHPEALVERMRPLVEREGRARIRAHLGRISDDLDSAFAGSPVPARVRSDLELLERSYG